MVARPAVLSARSLNRAATDFHGDVHYYYFGNALNAGAPKRLFMDPSDLLTVTYQQDYKFPLNNHEAGYSSRWSVSSRTSCISSARHHLVSSRRTRTF